HWHGLLETDRFRRLLLDDVAEHAGRTGFVTAPDTDVAAIRTAQLDLLADLVEQNLDLHALEALVAAGAPAGLPAIASTVLR
ncbi:cobyric acid synthase CobQ, partial [Rhodococcus sp. NPDC057014]